MHDRPSRLSARAVLVSDFDGTMSFRDFYQLVVAELVPAGTPNYWDEYRAGRITHFEALRSYFAAIDVDEAALIRVTQEMELDPNLRASVGALRDSGWDVVVASAGCDWYIRRLLAGAGVDLEVHANPGRFEDGHLIMELPTDSVYLTPTTGIDKEAVVRAALGRGGPVAFAGDGPTDLRPALLVPADLRFARDVLARTLHRQGEGFQPFERWSEIARALVARGDVHR